MRAGELILAELVVNMPRKNKPRRPVTPLDKVWIAPRPVNTSEPRAFEPVGVGRSNRYLEFADIAFGAHKTGARKKKADSKAEHNGDYQHPKDKVTAINTRRGPNFGAFRNSR
jgi:hypothetical protein